VELDPSGGSPLIRPAACRRPRSGKRNRAHTPRTCKRTRRFARHIETGELISTELVDRLKAAREFGRALFAQWLLFRSQVSLTLHESGSNEIGTTERVFELARRYLPYELPAGTHYEASFDHLPQYSAAYYTYLWSQAIAKDLLSVFSNGLMDAEQARRFRDQVLAPGGARPASELLANFLGRAFSFDAFATWLGALEQTSSTHSSGARSQVAAQHSPNVTDTQGCIST
jgi:Zn-dependent oligopeptidase